MQTIVPPAPSTTTGAPAETDRTSLPTGPSRRRAVGGRTRPLSQARPSAASRAGRAAGPAAPPVQSGRRQDVEDTAAISQPRPQPVRRRRAVSFLAVAIASLLMASGVVVTERVAGRDLRNILADIIRPDGTAPEGVAAPDQPGGEATSTDTPGTAGPAAAAPDAPAAGGPAPAGPVGPGSSATGASRPGPRGGGTPNDATPTGSTPGTPANPAPAGIGGPSTGSGPQPGTGPAAGERTGLELTVAELQPFVEREAGHTFTAPVTVATLSDTDFRARLDQLNWLPKGPDAERLEGVYRSLGLIGTNVDLATELTKFTRAEVVTLYDPVAGELLVRSVEPTPYVRSRLVRELTRALDDQHFDIYRPTLDDPYDEARDGLKALAEGDASRVHDRYVAGLPGTERNQVESERQRINRQTPTDINRAVLARFGYAVNAGPALVAALLDAGGRGRLDGAFASPPTTSEQVLHPDRYLDADNRRSVAEPAGDGAVEARGTLGEIGLLSMLSGTMDSTTAMRAAQGWGGDRYVSWRQGNLTCTRATIVTDTNEDAVELGAALGRWAAGRSGAEVSGGGPYTVKRCA